MAKQKHRAVMPHKPMSRSTGILIWLAITSPAILYWASLGAWIASVGMIAVAVWFGIQMEEDGGGNGEGAQHWDQGV